MGRTTQFADKIGVRSFCAGTRRPSRPARVGTSSLVEDVAYMTIDGLDAEEQLVRDGGVRAPARDQAQHLELAGGEPESRV